MSDEPGVYADEPEVKLSQRQEIQVTVTDPPLPTLTVNLGGTILDVPTSVAPSTVEVITEAAGPVIDLLVQDEETVVDISAVGLQGEPGLPGPPGSPGPPGPQGPPGTGTGTGGDVFYMHNQVAAATVWIVEHNLGKYPSVTVVDSGGTEIMPDVYYDSTSQVTLTFSGATSGKAYVN